MMKFLLEIYLQYAGIFVGEDEYGNKYYELSRKDYLGRKKRYCLFFGAPEASKIPPEWHLFMHHQIDAKDVIKTPRRYIWQKMFLPDLTLSCARYLPKQHPLYNTQNNMYSVKNGGSPLKFKAWKPYSQVL